jgi:hypothetical protein
MAEQIKRRAARARAGVAMVVLALVGGSAVEGTASVSAKTISWLNVKGFTGGVRNALLKIEKKIDSADSALASFEKKAERTYLKITTANASFLKIRDASQKYLKITDAASQFIQGHGGVITGSAALNGGTNQPLMGDGSVRVLIGLYQPPAGGPAHPSVTLENDTAQSLNFTVNGAQGFAPGSTSTIGGSGGTSTLLLPAVQDAQTGAGGQLDIQLYQSGGKVWTLTVSSLFTGGVHTFVGQMLLGN